MGFVSGATWLINKYRATVINDIWHLVLFFTAWAAVIQVICVVHKDISVSNQILTVLGTVLGLVVSFRTSSAYERYGEGRKLWTSIQLASRNLSILIWVHVPAERPLKAGQTEDPNRNRTLEAVIEKKSMINLVQAFSVSVKHMLRGEPGVYYEDLYPLLSFLPRVAQHQGVSQDDGLPVWHEYNVKFRKADDSTAASRGGSPSGGRTSDLEKSIPVQVELGPASNPPPTTVYDVLPFLIIFKPIVSLIRRLTVGGRSASDGRYTITGKRRKATTVESNVPLELSLFLSSYAAWLLKQGLVAPAVATALVNGIGSLQDAVANLNRVSTTPIPVAYAVHLRMCMWLYLFLLPFQIVKAYGWLVIPGTAFASFLLLGFLEIGQEIEDPFGYDENDLPLDAFCATIQRELHEITAHPVPEPSSYIFTAENQPFAPADRSTARQLVSDPSHAYSAQGTGMGSIHSTLLRSWREVNLA